MTVQIEITDRSQPEADDQHLLKNLNRLFLWVNSGCNARCRMCDIWREKPGRTLSVEDVRGWAPEWSRLDLEYVILCGESLMHPDIFQIAQIIREHGIRVELLSNGLLLKRHAESVAQHCDEFRVSLDGPREIHNSVRGVPRAFERLDEGLVELRRQRPDMGVDGRCAVHRLNFQHLRATVQAAKDLGLRSISFSGTDLHNEEAFRRFSTLDQQYIAALAVREADLPDLTRELELLREECAEDFASGYISDTPEELDAMLLQYYRGVAGVGPMPQVRCNTPWSSAILEYDGTVRPCFPMSAYGDIRVFGTLEAAINSPKALAFRRGLDVASDSTCQNCVCPTLFTGA
ncbi:radical SAM protein [Streptacidiphilus sp. 4-A2]|nr:radical SAM protein [Streptacidiphilus sp. 4-A2]